ncbi:MAG: DUF420 domain-containing protein [Gammaproteobacteria bacterium]|nr:DUF420 domain-containing protein [Gammaproteobacteria bacterium]
MDIIPVLPPVQALLNLTAASLMGVAYYHIRRQDRVAHRTFMLAALAVSGLFLVCYLFYHAQVGNIPFAGEGFIRPIYFTILATHVVLAAVIVPMVVITVTYAVKGKHSQHRRIARWTLPLWLYVSMTGVIIYLMAFHLYPPVQI